MYVTLRLPQTAKFHEVVPTAVPPDCSAVVLMASLKFSSFASCASCCFLARSSATRPNLEIVPS